MPHSFWQEYAPYLVPLLALVLIVRRNLRAAPRKVRFRAMWIMPAILTVAAVSTLATSPMPGILAVLIFAGALLVGLGIGHLRGRHLELAINGETGEVTSKATPVGTILIAALFVVRFGLKMAFPELGGQPGQGLHRTADALLWADGAMLFALGMIVGNAVTIWMRARPLVIAHRSGTLKAGSGEDSAG